MGAKIQHRLLDQKYLGELNTFPNILNLSLLICKMEIISTLWDVYNLETSYS